MECCLAARILVVYADHRAECHCSHNIYLQSRKKYRSVILAAKRNLESFDWSLITQAFLLRKYRFSSLTV